MKMAENGVARRNRIDLNCNAEAAIRRAVDAVENLGADPLLTEVVILLTRAREKVSDYVERCDTCDGARRIKSTNPLKDGAFMVPCPDCTDAVSLRISR